MAAVIAIGIAIYTLWVAIGSFARGLIGKSVFFSLATYYGSMPAAFALTMDNARWYKELGEGLVPAVLVFILLCMLGFHAGYVLSRRNAFAELPRKLYQPNERTIMVVCLVLWVVGLVGLGGLSLGAAWDTDWLRSAGVSGQADYGASGYVNAVMLGCLVIGPLAMIWAGRAVLLIACPPLLLMQALFAVASGGRWVLASALVPIGMRFMLKCVDKRRRDKIEPESIAGSFGLRLRILSLVVVAVMASGFAFSFIGYLRAHRQEGLAGTLASMKTYTNFMQESSEDRPWYLSWADGVWMYPYSLMRDVPGAIPIQPLRIATECGIALIPGYRRIAGIMDNDSIEQDLAQLYMGHTYSGATVHPTVFGLLYIFGGWFGVVVPPFLGVALRRFDDAVIRGRGFQSGLFWIGTMATVCYWCTFFCRGALQFAIFRALWAFYLWVIIYFVVKMLVGSHSSDLRADGQQTLPEMEYGTY